LRATAAEALLHYWWVGDRLGLKPHPWFDAASARQSTKSRPAFFTPILACYMADWKSCNSPHPLFDQAFYLQENADVRNGSFNPLLHFVFHGLPENRKPNGHFDPLWYREANADVANSGMPPSLHFALYGAMEGRNPGPDFDSLAYRLQVGQAALGNLDPLSHYLTVGRAAGVHPVTRALSVSQLVGQPRPVATGTVAETMVDVVVPVYRGLKETRACIESVLLTQRSNEFRLHIYNDESPEPSVTEYLRGLAKAEPSVIYVENETNLGFVGTVNRAMRAIMQRPDFDSVILLNSDTEVAGDWVRRLRDHARRDGNVASVTAMSNNATICSYPHFGDNLVPDDETFAGIDELAARVNPGYSVELPTGVGFCMLMTRQALQRIGLFDEKAFGKGYGEEVDFCQRAIQIGMKNLLALDVYVKHAGEVSFGSSSKPSKLIAESIIHARYPEYQADVTSFVRTDPGLFARLRLTFARWRERERDVRVLFTHALGGGTERHVQEAVKRLPRSTRAVVVRPAKANSQRMVLECTHPEDGFNSEIEISRGEDLAALLLAMGTQRVEVHHLLGFGDFLRQGLALAKVPFDFVVHDYYAACPQVTMTKADGSYCGEPRLRDCDQCIAQRPSHGAKDIRNWRINNEWLVLGSQQLMAPSRDSAARIQRYFQRMPEVRLHEDGPTPAVRKQSRTDTRRDGRLRVLVLGTLAPHKGRQLVLGTVEEALNRSLPLEFYLIGDPQGKVPKRLTSAFAWSGRYDESELDAKIEQAQGDVFLFPSQAPETYSYTLTAALRSGLPIVATHLGAFVERLADLPSTRTVAPDIAPAELAKILISMVPPVRQREGR
jgi:GT2 family glycosyltransferase/glycosyltransferase involved in cell wall biosynthesis